MKSFFFFSLILAFSQFANSQTLTSVQEMYQVLQKHCVSCHAGASPAAGLDLEGTGATNLTKAISVANKLVNKNPVNTHAAAAGNKLVYPGRPDRSFLFRKINDGLESTITPLHANEGLTMPDYPQPSGKMLDKEKEIIRQWILYGAKSTGVQFNAAVVNDWYDNNGIKSFPDGAPAAPAPSEGFQIKMGPFYLAPSGEVEYYQKYELNLPSDTEVNRLDMKFSGSSHHFIIYNFASTAAANNISHGLRLVANHSNINMVGAVQEPTDLRLPATTAFKWSKNIILDLNSHYINYSLERPLQCEVYVNIYTQALGVAQQEMFATLFANLTIPIPANGNTITHSKAEFQLGSDSLYIWGLMGHTHKYGTGFKVYKRQSNGQKGEIIYDGACPQGKPGCPSPFFDYQHIPMRYWEPTSLPIRWQHGIIHEATWQNYGNQNVSFGPTSDDEMQVLIAFYTLSPITVSSNEPHFESEVAAALQVFPNPAEATISFLFDKNEKGETLQIFNLEGQLVATHTPVQPYLEISIDNWQSGIYIYKYKNKRGKFLKI